MPKTKLEVNKLRTLLAYSGVNLGSYAKNEITASVADKTLAGNAILSRFDNISIPSLSLSTNDKISFQDLVDYVNLLASTVSLRTFRFVQSGCVPTVSYTRISALRPIAPEIYNTGLAQGAKIDEAQMTSINQGIRTLIDTQKGTVSSVQFNYCHCSCHGNCHGSRGRR